MAFRSSLLSLLIVLAPALSTGFITPKPRAASSPACKPRSTSLSATRRNFLEQSIATTATIILSTTPLPAIAKEAPPIITKQTVTEAFDAIRFELNDPSGVVASLTNLIENGSFEDIMQYTKESDAYFRRAKLGKARKLLTDKSLKGDAVLMSNAVTFDLIGINRASRPGKENKEEQTKYLGELKKDIAKFLELEGTIVVEE
ncbi:hypothetical protein ACHAXR_000464 [Thalassiosira sp. AJA248-18]